MTRRETTEIFAALKIGYPRAEMFKGGMETLKPTVELWAATLHDVDFAMAQRALYRVLRECKFPPTIAEFRTAVEAEEADLRQKAKIAADGIRLHFALKKTLDDYKPDSDVTRMAIERLGGIDRLFSKGERYDVWHWSEFESAYRAAYLGASPTFEKHRMKEIGGTT